MGHLTLFSNLVFIMDTEPNNKTSPWLRSGKPFLSISPLQVALLLLTSLQLAPRWSPFQELLHMHGHQSEPSPFPQAICNCMEAALLHPLLLQVVSPQSFYGLSPARRERLGHQMLTSKLPSKVLPQVDSDGDSCCDFKVTNQETYLEIIFLSILKYDE